MAEILLGLLIFVSVIVLSWKFVERMFGKDERQSAYRRARRERERAWTHPRETRNVRKAF
ncbi:MAG TPA: hypothetical protein VGC25_09920 [Alphaproteobacteria bacterium]|jgi:hypothetical protein